MIHATFDGSDPKVGPIVTQNDVDRAKGRHAAAGGRGMWMASSARKKAAPLG